MANIGRMTCPVRPTAYPARVEDGCRPEPVWRMPMSSSERQRRSKRARVLCAACQERKAKFRYRREVRANRDHTLCFESDWCEVNRTRRPRLAERATRLLAGDATRPLMASPFGAPQTSIGPALDSRQLAHRR